MPPRPLILSRRLIAGNATFLVVRTVMSTLIGLFTSRVVLQVLGTDDYGLSSVAGTLVGVLNFFTGSLAGAGSRFITYEMGRGDDDAVEKIFSATLFINIGLAVLILIFGETVGLWMLENKLNIAPDRMTAARWVYQLSVVSAAIGITQTPYSAVIMAHERISIYAGFDLLGMALKLLIVYLLMVVPGDKLIVYATLGAAVGLFMLCINRAYCMRHFRECRRMPRFDRAATRRIFGYSAFTMASSFCVMICFSGTTFMINIFFGVAANAAVALAATIHGITMLFGSNIQTAFRPQIVKQYAAGNTPNVWGLACMSAKFTLLILGVLVVPCIIEAPLVLRMWLGNVPPMAVEFLRCMLAAGWCACLSNQLDTVAYSSSRIGRVTAYKGTCFLLNTAAIYVLFALGAPAWAAYVSNGVMYIVLCAATMSVIKCRMPAFRIRDFVASVGRSWAVVAASLLPLVPLCIFMDSSLLRLAIIIVLFSAMLAVLAWRFVLTAEERRGIVALVRDKAAWLLNILPVKFADE